MKKLRKFLVASVMTLSVIAMSGLAVAPANAAASAGDLIKMDGLSSVYYLGDDGKRYVFPNESTYFSWYSDFSGVVTIPASELQSYPLGGNVTMRPGTTLVKITTDPSVYAVEPNGVLRKIANESQAAALYGTNWNKRIVDLADAFFTNYTIGQPLADGEVPVGSLVKNADSASVYYYDGTNYRMIASEAAMTANRFSFSNVMTISNDITAGGTAVTGMEAGLVKTSQGATGPGQVVTGSGLMVSLNSQTPASMNIPGGSSVEFLKLNLTAASDGAVNVSSIKLTAYGLSDGQNIDDVTFYDNGMKVGTSKDVNSDRVATFNFATPIYVAAGSTKTLTVKATVAVNTGSYGLGIASASDIIATSASVTGSFPVVGNTMSAVAGSLGGVTIEDIDVSNSVNFGEDDVLLADFTLETTSQENVLLQSISLYNGGTNSDDIMSNLRMYIDGEEVATGSYVDRYATFSLDGYEIEKSTNVSVEVRGDMGITSDGDTVKLYLKDNIDFVAVGKTHGFSVSLTNDFDAIDTIITLNTGDFTIDMDKSATPSKDVKPDTKDVELATLTLKSNGENATITDIAGSGFYVISSATSTLLLENAELYDTYTGSFYDLAIATSSTTTHQTLTLSDEIALTKGVARTFKIRADVRDIVPEGTTFQVELNGNAMTIEGDVSGASITDITPSSVSSAITTVKDASLTLTPITLTNVNVVGGSSDVVVYQGKLKAGTADGVKIISVKLNAAISATSTLAFTNSNVSKLTLLLNGKVLQTASNKINETTDTITFSSLDTDYYTIPAGMEYDLVVTADFSSSLTAGDFDLSIDATGDISARSVIGNNTVTPSVTATDSRQVTAVEKGTLTVQLATSDAKANRDSFLLAGSETEAGRYLGEIKFTTANEDIKVKKLTLTNGGTATNADLSSVKLVKADGTVVATETVEADGDVVFDPFDVVFEKDQTTSLFVVAVAKGLNDGDPTATATSGTTAQYTLSTTTAMGNESGADITVNNSAGTSKTATIVGSKLNSVVNAMSDGQLTGGLSKTIGKYTLTFDNGANRNTSDNTELKAVLSKFVVTMSTSSAVSLANVKLHVDGTSDKVVADTFTGGAATWAAALSGLTDSAKMDGSVTLVITADVTTTAADGEYVQTSIADLDGASDINYTSNGVSHTSMYLPVIEVVGGTLSE